MATVPARLFDTRSPQGGGALAAGATRLITIAGQGGLPESGVAAVVVNLTATQAQPGFLRLWPSGGAPETSNLNVDRLTQTIANLAIVAVGPDGKIRLQSQNGGHAVIDLVGYFTDDSAQAGGSAGYFVPVAPAGLGDSRIDLHDRPRGYWFGGRLLQVPVAGRFGVPGDAAAVLATMTVTAPTASGWAIAGPFGTGESSNVNYDKGATIANLAVARPDEGGLQLVSTVWADLIADVSGYFTG